MKLTDEEEAILAHVVVDPDVWVAHALATVGEKAVKAKIDRWRPIYEKEANKPNYKNRMARESVEQEALKPTIEQLEKSRVEGLIKTKVREQAIAALIKEGTLTPEQVAQ